MTKYDEIQRNRERLVNSVVGLSPQIPRVTIRWSDIEKIVEWEDRLAEKGEGRLISTNPFLNDAFYVIETVEQGFVGIRFQYIDGMHKFAMYFMKSGEKVPSYPQFVFNVSNLEDIDTTIKMNAIKGDFDIVANTYHQESAQMDKAKSGVNAWAGINHFMINFERDVQVVLYQNKTHRKGAGSRGKNIKKITSKIYRCYLPDNWLARNEKEYTTPEWEISGHWHRRIVNEDFIERKAEEIPEFELIKKYRLSSDQNPLKEGKIYVDIYHPATKASRSEHLLSEDHTGMKPIEYVI